MDQGQPTAPPHGHRPGDHPPAPGGPRRLYREPGDKKLSGICSGLADHTGVDPTVMRAIAIALAVVAPITVLAYVIATFVIDERPPSVPRITAPPVEALERYPWLPVAVIVGAVVLGVGGFGGIGGAWWWFDVPLAAPILIGVGVWLLVRNKGGRDEPPRYDPPAGPPAGPPNPGPFGPSTDQPRTVVHPFSESPWLEDRNPDLLSLGVDTTTENEDAGSRADQSADLRDAADDAEAGRYAADPRVTGSPPADDGAGPPGGLPPLTPPGWSGPGPAPGGQPPATLGTRPERSQRLGLVVTALILLGVGSVWLLDATTGVDVDPRDVLAGVVLAAGGGLVLATWWGRARVALVPIGLVAIGGLVSGEVIDVPLDAGVGDRTVEVTRRAQLDDPHELLSGSLTVDLRDAPLPRAGTTEVTAGVGVGELRVVVPREANVVVHTDLVGGEMSGDLPDTGQTGGVMLDETHVLEGREGAPRLELTLHVGFGSVEVLRA
jgi:phage shock protein PspC (stress-responsive transcriptional regulator)